MTSRYYKKIKVEQMIITQISTPNKVDGLMRIWEVTVYRDTYGSCLGSRINKLKMLHKGLVTKSKGEFLYVWSKSFGGEAILDKRQVPASEYMPLIGDWIVFSVKVGSDCIDDFTDIPDILPTKVSEHGCATVKTRISFRTSNVSGCNLLAHSNDLGVIGIFQNFASLNENYDCDVWAERIPQALSNLEHIYKTSWYISDELPEQVAKTSLERFSSVQSLSSRCNSHTGLPNAPFKDSCSDIATYTSKSSLSSVDIDFDESQENNRLCKRSLSKQTYFTELSLLQEFFDPEPCPSAEAIKGEETDKGKTIVGLITSVFNGKAFVWSSVLGTGVISLRFGQEIRHGKWIKFTPTRIDDICLEGRSELRGCKYTAEDWCIISPVYPTRSFRTIISVQVKLFVPQGYRNGASNLWAEFFGTVYDSLGRIAEFGHLNNISGRCLLVRIMEMKSDCDTSNSWVVHKVIDLLENEESVPKLKSQSFAADALRYMNEDSLIHNVMKKVDWNLVKQLEEPHFLPNDILEHQN
uniref:CST complex subunit CTC1 n=1 Tax=Elaeophora elaphi TaxID=1147741 RepID=A0A0R3S6J3_9BILA